MSKVIKLKTKPSLGRQLFNIIVKLIAICIIILHLLPFIFMFIRGSTNLTMPHSFIHIIHAPKLGSEKLKNTLDYFNTLSYYKPVNFENGFRPIFIYERPLGDDVLGFAAPLPLYCLIVLNQNLKPNLVAHTLLHEYVHCFNYLHNPNLDDLMYPYENTTYVNEQNIKYYAEQIGKIIEQTK